MSDIQGQLKEHLKNAEEWGKMETPIPGVFVVKVPGSKTRPPMLFLEINPLKSNGKPMKRKGLFVRDYEMLVKFSEALTDDKVIRLIKELEDVNPDEQKNKTKKLKM
jgi:hypothetical protein